MKIIRSTACGLAILGAVLLSACGEGRVPPASPSPAGGRPASPHPDDFAPRFLSTDPSPDKEPVLKLLKKIVLKTPPGQPLRRFHSVSAGPSGIYIADIKRHRIVRFDPAGKFLQFIGEALKPSLQINKSMRMDTLLDGKRLEVPQVGTGLLTFNLLGRLERVIDEPPQIRRVVTITRSQHGNNLLACFLSVNGPYAAIFGDGKLKGVFYSQRRNLAPSDLEFRPNLAPLISLDSDYEGHIYAVGRVDYDLRTYDRTGRYLGDFRTLPDPYYQPPPDRLEPGEKERLRIDSSGWVKWEATWTQVESIAIVQNRYLIVCLNVHGKEKFRLHFYDLKGRGIGQRFWPYRLVGRDEQDRLYFTDNSGAALYDGSYPSDFQWSLWVYRVEKQERPQPKTPHS